MPAVAKVCLWCGIRLWPKDLAEHVKAEHSPKKEQERKEPWI